ncbi:kinase-like protein [Paxillus ammoniavirescens]|nr:kinase-like protein [Paxillus ammoniavirescens]
MGSSEPDSEFNEALLNTYTDEQVTYRVNQSPTLTTTRTESIRLLSDHLVAKSVPWPEDYRDETDVMDKARSVGVNVPAVRRIVPLPEGDHLVVMERIHGKTLEQLWPGLGLWSTIRIAWQLRSFVSALRTATSQKTGGVSSGCVNSEWIQGINGPVPHASPTLFCDYLNWWLVKARPSNCQPLPQLLLSPPRDHVLVHQDLAPRNMILDLSGRLWLVDWGRSGFYPAFMEYLGMEGPERAMPWLAAQSLASWWGRCRWFLFCSIACGYSRLHSKGRAVLAVVRQRSLRYKLEKPPHSVRY